VRFYARLELHNSRRVVSGQARAAIEHQSKISRAGHEHGIIKLGGGVFQTRLDIVRFKVGVISKDICFRHSRCDEIQHILYPDAYAPDARPSAALAGVKRDALLVIHVGNVGAERHFLKVDIQSRQSPLLWLKRFLQRQIETKLVRALISGEVAEGSTV